MAIDLLSKLDRTVPEPAREALHIAIDLAGERSLALALVGGGVRDLLLGGSQIDLDLVVTPGASAPQPQAARAMKSASAPQPQAARAMKDGSSLTIAIELADAVVDATGGRAVAHRRFGTATVRLPAGHLDMARARSERYQSPGALPEVAPASLEEDLARRDFTVNAMALRLNGDEAGRLVDPHGGQADLERKLIRTLHDASFRDDATRILRALRYAGRLGFELEAGTAASLDRARELLATIGGARLRREIERTAVEERAGAIARALVKHDVLAAIDPALRPGDRELLVAAEIVLLPATHRDVALLSTFVWRATPGDAERVIDRLALTRRQATSLREVIALRDATPRLAAASRPSDVARLLDAYAPVAIESFALLTDDPLAAGRAHEYLSTWRQVRSRLSGNDVEALGVAHGPAVGEALARLRAARLDGETATRDEEVALVASLARQPVVASRG